MLRLVFISILVLAFKLSSLCQLHNNDTLEYTDNSQEIRKNNTNSFKYSMSVGASYTLVPGSTTSYFSNYFFPKVSYKISPKFDIEVGIIALKNYINSDKNNFDPDIPFSIIPSSSLYLVSNGNYNINKRVKFHGQLIKKLTDDFPGTEMPSRAYENYSIGLDYKISNSINIGIQFKSVNNNRLYYPFY